MGVGNPNTNPGLTRLAVWQVGRVVLLGLLAVVGVCAAGQRGLPAREGILNFGQVDERLYRGAQPDAAGMQRLQQLGVKSIINLRTPGESWTAEASQAQASGLIFTNIPLHGYGRPTPEDVNKVLALIESLPAPIFVHCRHGCDRTGTIVACYRIEHDGWSAKTALIEAKRYGMSMWERGMRRFVRDFAKPPSRKPEPLKKALSPRGPERT